MSILIASIGIGCIVTALALLSVAVIEAIAEYREERKWTDPRKSH